MKFFNLKRKLGSLGSQVDSLIEKNESDIHPFKNNDGNGDLKSKEQES